MDEEMKLFCRQLPKLELHAHLNGSLSMETIQELKKTHQISGENNSIAPHWNTVINHGDSRSLQECFELFKIVHALTCDAASVQRATEDVVRDFSQDGVVYLELRSTPREVPGVMTKRQYIYAILRGIEEAQKKCDIIVKILLSVDRKQGMKMAEENVELSLQYNQKYPNIFTGIDVSGDPTKENIQDYLPLLTKARQNGLKISVHCAEVPETLQTEAILGFKPDRIGHGTCIHSKTGGTSQLWTQLLQSKIPVEICLTSNVKCKTVPNYEEHHFKFLFEAGHPVILATDDKGVFETTLSEELITASCTYGLSRQQLWQLSYDAVKYAFTTEEEKTKLSELLTKWKLKDNNRAISL